ncbi:MAG TPA: hypothetical protein VGR20_15210, partial [Acidimicrobiia bacterium]|nr:hypothetical protein [Acidimicrobiia bacterium]
ADLWDRTDLDWANLENDAAASIDMAERTEAEAIAYDRDRADADLNAWYDAIEAGRADDRAAQDLYGAGLLPV